jgi:hypothetical protein
MTTIMLVILLTAYVDGNIFKTQFKKLLVDTVLDQSSDWMETV